MGPCQVSGAPTIRLAFSDPRVFSLTYGSFNSLPGFRTMRIRIHDATTEALDLTSASIR